MSLWKIGADDVTQETQQFKDKLASKDGHIASQQAQIMKQNQEMEELRESLSEAIQKLAREGDRILELQRDLSQCKEDLRNEKDTRHNVQLSLEATRNKLKTKETEARDLEAILERVSGTSNDQNSRSRKLQEEKTTLENRIRELETNIRHMHSAAAATSRRRSRSSSSQFHDLRINSLEKDLRDLRTKSDEKDSEMKLLQEKLAHAQGEFLRVDNERLAKEAKNKVQLEELQSLLREKTEELDFYRERQEGGGREEELLQRIEEDEAKIAALEATLRQSGDTREMKEKLRNVQQRFKAEADKVILLESQNQDLEQERDHLLNELESMQNQARELERQVEEKQEQIDHMAQERSCLISALDETESGSSDPPTDDHDALTATNGVNYQLVEKLLNAIARLRGERDELRRRLEFLETEHKFTVEALEKQSDMKHHLPIHDQNGTLDQAPILSLPRMLTRSSNRGTQRVTQAVEALATLLLHSQSRIEEFERSADEIAERERNLKCHSEADTEKYSKLREESDLMADQLEQSEELARELEDRLCKVTTQRDKLALELEGQKEEMKVSQKGVQNHLEELDGRLGEVSRTLEVVESERDSLVLQVNNLTADLRAAQDDLESAESRYSSLQFHQLSNMSSSEAAQALQEQIAELEGRVMRRTEQIGIQQHDISRLETNLKLQEERLGELTMELEVLTTQKEAMLEDCADAREARDEALSQIETLEEEMESLDSRFASSEKAVTTLICLLVQTTAQVKSLTRQSRSHIVHLEDQLKQSQVLRENLEADLAKVRGSATEDAQQLTVAFADSQLQLRTVNAIARNLIMDKDGLAHNLALADKQLRQQEAIARGLGKECVTLRSTSSTSAAELASQSSEYQVEINKLRELISHLETESELSQQQLIHSTAESQRLQRDKELLVLELEKAKLIPTEEHEMDMSVRQELATAIGTLNEERANWAALEKKHAEMLSKAQLQIDELDNRAHALTQEVSRLSTAQEDAHVEKEKALQNCDSLRVELEILTQEKQELEEDHRGIVVTNEQLIEDISRLAGERDALATIASDQRQRELEAHKSELETRVDSLTRVVEDRTQEIKRLQRELDFANQCLGESGDKYTNEIQSLTHERETAYSSLAALKRDVEELQDAVKRNDAAMTESEEEKDRLQEHITALEAQVQKSLSYTNTLERQISDREHALEELEENLKHAQVELSRAETTAKTAEMNLSLQNAQFKRELAKLQDKLSALQPRQELEDAVSSLQETNKQMEELLKAKCAEIEENDDRALEMMKENKKLSNKLEALNRKIQNLQNKLTAAKAAVADSKAVQPAAKPSPDPVVQPPPDIASRPSPQPNGQVQEQEKHSQTNRRRSSRLSTGATLPAPVEKSVTVSVAKPSTSSRITSSGTSQAPRSITPERLAPTPVFKIRTPERSRAQDPAENPAPVVGVKRRAPDDFEACEAIPPQGFTTDSIPSGENDAVTPRVRRMFGNLQSGFTPIRNKVLSSPKRQSQAVMSTPLMQDVTNSPRSVPPDSAAKHQKSWLRKIRGTTTSHVTTKPANRRVFTSRGDPQ